MVGSLPFTMSTMHGHMNIKEEKILSESVSGAMDTVLRI
jgi:hypothetical protein